MIEDITAEINDIQTLVEVALVDDNLQTSQAVLRVIEQKTPRLIEILDKLTLTM